jgi:chromosomal replication initiation ATPase DnaA
MISGDLKNRITVVLMRDFNFTTAQALEIVDRIDNEQQSISIEPGSLLISVIEEGLVCIFGLSLQVLRTRCKKQKTVYPRYAVMELLAEKKYSQEEIASVISRGRSNVCNALNTIKNMRQTGFEKYTTPADLFLNFVRGKISPTNDVLPPG